MISFIISLIALIAGYFVYGRVVEKVFGPDNRVTPAVGKADGVDYIVLPRWKVFMIQFLNIAGTGPIFGAIMGAKFGPSAYLWIVIGYLFDGVRAGILLYGYAPFGFYAKGFRPALKVYARRTQVTPFIGGGIGYNPADRKYGNLSVYRLGYADGFFRGVPLGEKTLCMDAFISDGGEKLRCVLSDADAYAKLAGTISYEVLTSVTKRSERVYLR